MGTRLWACECWSITYDDLKALCEADVAAVEDAIGLSNCNTWGEQCGWHQIGSDDCWDDAVSRAASRLQAAFSEATGGLTLEYLAYDSDMDCTHGRDVYEWEGVIFQVNGVETFTPAGRAMQHRLRKAMWIDAG